MLFSAFVALSFAASVFAAPSKRFEGLAVSVTAPSSVGSVDDVKLVATVTNNNAEAIKILKFNTILDPGLTASFDVVKDGAAVKFQGIAVSSKSTWFYFGTHKTLNSSLFPSPMSLTASTLLLLRVRVSPLSTTSPSSTTLRLLASGLSLLPPLSTSRSLHPMPAPNLSQTSL